MRGFSTPLRSGRNDSFWLRLRRTASLLFFALFASFVVTPPSAVAAEPFFKKGDVIALVGGEDMVAMSEYGYLELLLTRALPEHRLKFRNLAWEGDTVFEQRRDLNFPPLEAQLDQVGATVVLCQFGQMESLAGKEKLPEFVAAYEKLIARMSGGKRRGALLSPNYIRTDPRPASEPFWESYAGQGGGPTIVAERLITVPVTHVRAYIEAIEVLAGKCGAVFLPVSNLADTGYSGALEGGTRDGFHLSHIGHFCVADSVLSRLGLFVETQGIPLTSLAELKFSGQENVRRFLQDGAHPSLEPLRRLIVEKNRLWFDYWRVQNWAFLAGDRTEQPSSRDHVDRTKRWFPAEREQFLPLIDAKEQEIWTLAAKLAKP